MMRKACADRIAHQCTNLMRPSQEGLKHMPPYKTRSACKKYRH